MLLGIYVWLWRIIVHNTGHAYLPRSYFHGLVDAQKLGFVLGKPIIVSH
jgi:hypothetical protein